MALVFMLVVMQFLMMQQVEQARSAVMRDGSRLSARVLAHDGIEYARACGNTFPLTLVTVAARLGNHPDSPGVPNAIRLKSHAYTSRQIGSGHFTVEFVRKQGALWIRSTGQVDDPHAPASWTEEVPMRCSCCGSSF